MAIRLVKVAAVIVGIVSVLVAQPPARAADTRPNVIFIFTDDHASLAISAYGSKINKTPNIDKLAESGMRFNNCFVTNSLCGPSRAVIQTGKYSHINGFFRNGNRFDNTQQTFPKLLQKAGYQTAIIGKWHLATDPTGFDYSEVLIGQGPYYNPPMIRNGQRVNHTGYTTEIVTDLALDWLKSGRDKSKPFMLMYQHKAPHRNWQPGPKYLSMYDDVTIPEPDTLFDDYAGRGTAAHQQKMMVANDLNAADLKLVPPGNLTPEQRVPWDAAYNPKNEAFRKANLTGKDLVRWKYQRYIKDYLRCVAAVDDNIGRLTEYLKESGLDKNTVIMYASDQGWYLGEHGWFDKRWMYEESLHTPFIVKWPGVVKPGSVNGDMVSNLDFAETFLDIAGVDVPADMQGRSLVPILKGRTPGDWRKTFYYHYYEFPGAHNVAKHYGVRGDRFKLIHFYQLDEWELYDLKNDPHEMRSIYNDTAYTEVVTQMKAELKRLQAKYGDTNPQQPVPGDPGRRQARKFTAGKLQEQFRLPADQVRAFDGKTALPAKNARPDVSSRPFIVGAWVNPSAGDGVVIAQGGQSFGFSLYLKAGKPHLAVRSNDNLVEVAADKALPLNTWSHLAGALDEHKQLRLYVNGKATAAGKGQDIASQPADVLSIGADTGSLVGDYEAANGWQGQLKDVRYYIGVLPDKDLGSWASE